MNRKKSPKTAKELKIGNIKPTVVKLKNSVPVYMIEAGTQPVVKIDFVFRAGSWWQSKALAASATNDMLSEGTSKNTAKEIANKLDYYGIYLNNNSDMDNASVSLYSLTRNLGTILPLLAEIIINPVFPDSELLTYKERRKQSFIIESSKVANIARENFIRALYGSKHPYGRSLSVSDFGKLSRKDIQDFHKKHYKSDNCKIIVSGKYNENKLIDELNEFFGGVDWTSRHTIEISQFKKRTSTRRYIFVPKKDALQSALRIGRVLFNDTHSDYPGMLVLNNILGGHFGSRLMQNVREKKGYTYGIGSALIPLKNSGFFVLASELGTGYQKAAIKEIYKEIDKLCNKHVSKKELEYTRSYMFGELLRAFDGPFAWSESIKTLVEHDIDMDFYHKITETIANISPADIYELAQKYLSADNMYEVLAGNASAYMPETKQGVIHLNNQ